MSETLELVAEMRSSSELDFEIKKKSFALHKKVLTSLILVSDLNEVFLDPKDVLENDRKFVNVHTMF